MQGVNCLQDLKKKLAEAGFEILGSHGWYLDTAHGRWTMSLGKIYVDGELVYNISNTPIKKKFKKSKKK